MIQGIAEMEQEHSRTEAKGAYGKSCIGCGAPERVGAGAGTYEEYCSRCAQMHEVGDVAVDNLAHQIAALLPAWKRYWAGRGADPQYLREILEPVERVLLNSHMRQIITEAFDQG